MIKKNTLTPLLLAGIFVFMLGLSFAAVPLYDLFCRVTGFGGTTQISKEAPKIVLDKIVNVRLDTNVNSQLDWDCAVNEKTLDVQPGKVYLDPELVNDPKTKNIEDVTMSYTFFSSDYYKVEKNES